MISDIENRILSKLDGFDVKIDDLCERIVRVETTVANHLEHQQQNFKRTTLVFGMILGVIGFVVALK